MGRKLCVLAATTVLAIGCGEKSATDMVAGATDQVTEAGDAGLVEATIPPQEEPALSAAAEAAVVLTKPVPKPELTPFEKLCNAYASGDGDAWTAAEKELFELGAEATPSLVAALSGGAAHERELAASMMAQIGSITPEARAALKTSLQDESQFVQANAVATLCAIEDGSPEVLAALQKLLSMEDKDSRMMAISSAGNLGTKAATLVPSIKLLLEDDDTELRDVARAAVARINGEELATDGEKSVILPASSSRPIE